MPAVAEPEYDPADTEYVRSLIEAEESGEGQALLVAGPYTTFLLMGALQLVLRHPDIGPQVKEHLRDLLDILCRFFDGTHGEDLIRRGDRPLLCMSCW